MKHLILTVFVILIPGAYAAASGATVKVNGMVCSFCSTSIEKKFKEKSEVSAVKVNLDSKLVSITYADGKQLTDEQIKEIIKKSGYAVVSIEHQDDALTPDTAKAKEPDAPAKAKGSKN